MFDAVLPRGIPALCMIHVCILNVMSAFFWFLEINVLMVFCMPHGVHGLSSVRVNRGPWATIYQQCLTNYVTKFLKLRTELRTRVQSSCPSDIKR